MVCRRLSGDENRPKVEGRRHRGRTHVSARDRPQIKCLQTVNDCNNYVTMYSVWDLRSSPFYPPPS
jgi:hypothetical protein